MSEKDKPAGAGFFGTKKLLKKYKKDTPGESVEEVYKKLWTRKVVPFSVCWRKAWLG